MTKRWNRRKNEEIFRAVAEEGSNPDKNFVAVPIKETDVPPGSVLSERTLGMIRNGEFSLPFSRAGVYPEEAPPRPTQASMTYQARLKARFRAKHPNSDTRRKVDRETVFNEARSRIEGSA